MKDIMVKDILKVTGGKLIIGDENKVCNNFSRDTRNINKGDTYIGLKGENFDGSLFWREAFEKGADAVIIQGKNLENEDVGEWKEKVIIQVEDTLKALQEIAKFKRSLYDIPVIAITGSVGKTSTKDMIANVVSQKYKTLKTEGNNNNHIGLPFTLLRMRDEEVAVIEMGMNHFGEISNLTKIAKPTISVITNIGTSHIGNLGSRENILKAKLEILEGMKKKFLIINNDNDMLHEWKQKQEIKDIRTYGIENESEVMADKIELKEEYSEFECCFKDEKFKIKVPVSGIHFVYNAMCAALVGKILGLTKEQIKKGIESFELTKKRMDIEVLVNGVKIINDSYNASFESMQASLSVLGKFTNERKIAVLGDMFELGEYSKELHEKVGKEVVKNNIDILICNGENAKYIVQEAERQGMKKENIYYVKEKKEIIELLRDVLKINDVVLFKASNGMKFYEMVEKVKMNFRDVL